MNWRVADEGLDVIITGAGMANHLSGTCDAYLRYGLRDMKIVVIGVAFEGDDPADTEAAKLSISRVPVTQVVWKDKEGQFVGTDGFLRACKLGVDVVLPELVLPKPKPQKLYSLSEAIKLGLEQRAKRVA